MVSCGLGRRVWDLGARGHAVLVPFETACSRASKNYRSTPN